MKFIFPKNYKTTGKLFGFIDSGFAIFLLALSFSLFFILKNLSCSLYIKTIIFIVIIFPLFILGITQSSNENFFIVLIYIFLFFLKPSLYLFYKTSKDHNFYINHSKHHKVKQKIIKLITTRLK